MTPSLWLCRRMRRLCQAHSLDRQRCVSAPARNVRVRPRRTRVSANYRCMPFCGAACMEVKGHGLCHIVNMIKAALVIMSTTGYVALPQVEFAELEKQIRDAQAEVKKLQDESRSTRCGQAALSHL